MDNVQKPLYSRRLLAVLMIAAFFAPLWAEDSHDAADTEARDVHQRQMDVLKAQADSPLENMKLSALDMIKTLHDSGDLYRDDPRLYEILTRLGSEVYQNPVRSGIGPVLENDFPLVRKQAAIVLGTLGGEQAVNPLMVMLKYEEDPDVQVLLSALQGIKRTPN